jgi:signal transduction histidine kinase
MQSQTYVETSDYLQTLQKLADYCHEMCQPLTVLRAHVDLAQAGCFESGDLQAIQASCDDLEKQMSEVRLFIREALHR